MRSNLVMYNSRECFTVTPKVSEGQMERQGHVPRSKALKSFLSWKIKILHEI
jgi:hypothetical protein